MHELTIARNIIDIVAAEAGRKGVSKVSEVCLEIGLLAGIEYDSLDFAMMALKKGTVMESATISTEKPSGGAKCNQCGNAFSFESFMGKCERCGSFDLSITKGMELRVKTITI
jgi:hydrogenase nickel incorporation protein HypA/HybF